MNPGDRVFLTIEYPRCGERREGIITAIRDVAGRPLLTVRLETKGWPGGYAQAEPGGLPGQYVNLREDEVERARPAPPRRSAGGQFVKQS